MPVLHRGYSGLPGEDLGLGARCDLLRYACCESVRMATRSVEAVVVARAMAVSTAVVVATLKRLSDTFMVYYESVTVTACADRWVFWATSM